MKPRLFIALVAMAALVTGCPHNEYIVDLTPHGPVIERALTFFCEDGVNTNGATNFSSFSADELKAITALYPAAKAKTNEQPYTVRGSYSGALPHDIGGAGMYSNYSTSLGSAALYTERFRGDDDLATMTEARLRAADKLVDHVIGWSKLELSGEPHYQDLRRFLDTDFRRDAKNFTLYWWLGDIAAHDREHGGEEYVVRVGQDLVEHGYLKTSDLPDLFRILDQNDHDGLSRLVRRLVAQKLRLPESRLVPKSLAFLADANSMEASWENYLTTTPEYHRLLEKWHQEKLNVTWFSPSYLGHKTGILRGPATNAAPPPKPQPTEALQEIVPVFIADFRILDTPDGITVNLALPAPPLHSNGKWDEALKKVTWHQDLEGATNYSPVPAFFFAAWAEPDETFQKAHFGKVLVNGDELMGYCLWIAGLNRREAAEWETLLAGIHPGDNLTNTIGTFHFSDEIQPTGTNAPTFQPSNFPHQLFNNSAP